MPQVLQFQSNFIPAQATTKITYAANLPTRPSTVASSTAPTGTLTALGGLNPGDFTPGFNPQVIGPPATPFSDATYTGSAVNNKAAVPAPITGATTLSGVPGTDSLTANFAVGDTLTVNGTVVTFVAAGAVGNQLNITDSVTALMAKIDSITGTASPSTVSGGAVTLHTGTASNLTVTSSNASALGALGFPSTVTASRGGGGTVGAGVVIGSDVTVFTNESISGGAVTAFDATGTAINLQLRWAKTDSASLGVGHTDTWNLFYQTNASATGAQTAWINAGTNFVFGTNGALVSPSGTSIVLSNVAVNNQSLGNLTFNHGAGGITQYASNGGTATINQVQQTATPPTTAVGCRQQQRLVVERFPTVESNPRPRRSPTNTQLPESFDGGVML